jgi:hypothetical protein
MARRTTTLRGVLGQTDYYDLKAKFGSEDPTDPKKTLRVLTVMLAKEY